MPNGSVASGSAVFWEHMIRDDADFRAHMDHVHFNPVKHGLVSHPRLWPYFSYHRAVARGEVGADETPPCPDGEFGERPSDGMSGSAP